MATGLNLGASPKSFPNANGYDGHSFHPLAYSGQEFQRKVGVTSGTGSSAENAFLQATGLIVTRLIGIGVPEAELGNVLVLSTQFFLAKSVPAVWDVVVVWCMSAGDAQGIPDGPYQE
jgi:hypothetical protein